MEVALASPLPLPPSLSPAMIPTPDEFDAPSFEINRMFGRSASRPAALYYLLNFPLARFLPSCREKADRPDSFRKMDANCRLTTFRYNRSRPCVSFLPCCPFPSPAPLPFDPLGKRGGELATLSCCLKCQNRWTVLSRGRSFYRRDARWRILLRLINAIRCR